MPPAHWPDSDSSYRMVPREIGLREVLHILMSFRPDGTNFRYTTAMNGCCKGYFQRHISTRSDDTHPEENGPHVLISSLSFSSSLHHCKFIQLHNEIWCCLAKASPPNICKLLIQIFQITYFPKWQSHSGSARKEKRTFSKTPHHTGKFPPFIYKKTSIQHNRCALSPNTQKVYIIRVQPPL